MVLCTIGAILSNRKRSRAPQRGFLFLGLEEVIMLQERCTTRGVSLPQSLDKRLQEQARREQRKVSTVIAIALRMYLSKVEAIEKEKVEEVRT